MGAEDLIPLRPGRSEPRAVRRPSKTDVRLTCPRRLSNVASVAESRELCEDGMRTLLDIEPDLHEAAERPAQSQERSLAQVVSELLFHHPHAASTMNASWNDPDQWGRATPDNG